MKKILNGIVLRPMLMAAPFLLVESVGVRILDDMGVSGSYQALAQKSKKDENQPQYKTRKTPAISQKVLKKLTPIVEVSSPEDENVKPDFKAALQMLKKLEPQTAKWNPAEKATLYNYFGFAYYNESNTPKAIEYFEKLLAQSPNIAVGMEVNTIKTVAQLHFSEENYKKAIGYFQKWLKLQDPRFIRADDYVILGQAYYQDQDFNSALRYVNKAVGMYESEGKTPKENWFALQQAMYYQKQEYKTVISILEKLVKYYPKPAYYTQLAGMFGLVKEEKKQMYLSDANYLAGMLTKEKQILNVAYMHLGEEYPYRAAKVLEKGIKNKQIEATAKNLDLLATAWSFAKETDKSIAVLSEAAGKSDKGDLYAKLVTQYLSKDQNKNAVSAASKALKKGGLKNPGYLYFDLGMANANLGKYQSAISAFQKAKKYKKTEKLAVNWIKYCEKEIEREKALAQG